ncbi:ATP-binding protein [Enterobacter bugandensis]|nr:ATP-binding protein [Enterobacter bugandensis]
MPSRIATLLIVMALSLLSISARATSLFSEEEHAWMVANPVISYSVQQEWPLDYSDRGRHFGLSRAYLDQIEKMTGLRFKLAEEPRKAALVTNLAPSLMTDTERAKWLFSQRWITTNALMIARDDASNLRTLEHLRGKRVAVRKDSDYERWLRRFHPEIHLFPQEDMPALLRSVREGDADVAIGADLIIRPLLYRSLGSKLVVSGQLPSLVAGLHMGTLPELPLLKTIIDKALGEMPASRTDAMFSQWIGDLKIGKITAGMIFGLYQLELSLIALLLLGLAWALWRALWHRKRAVASEARMSQFLAVMSHEIRTPMNAMIAALELLRLPGTPSQRNEYLALAHSSSTHLMNLLNDILDHSKLSHSQLVLSRQGFSLKKLVDDLVAVHRPLAAQKRLLLNVTLDTTLERQWIVGDAHRLRQVISNLLSNAIKFTEAGSVTLLVSAEPYDNTEGLRFTVCDTGIGIPLEAQLTLFDAWTQADSSAARSYSGSGLGLYICKELVKLAGGRLSCTSRPGEGATFIVELPVIFCDVSVEDVSESATVREFVKGTSVLIVEDHPANQAMMAAQLGALNCHYDIAGEGMEALALLAEENYYDVILLDCNLPDIDGYEVARRIRAFESAQGLERTPIVAISALSGSAHQQKCLDSGMQALLTKPLRLSCLSSMLMRWCQTAGTMSTEVVNVRPEGEVASWLLQDIAGFAEALKQQDARWMLHHIHRLHGAAKVYAQHALAECAAAFEQQMREDNIPSVTEGERWIEQLKRHLSATHL